MMFRDRADAGLLAVGQGDASFPQTFDEEVTRLLATRWTAPVPAATPDDDPARECTIDLGTAPLAGDLAVPLYPVGVVVFAHGSGSSRHSPRNRTVAHLLNESRLATLL